VHDILYKESSDRIYIIEESKIDSHASQFSAIRSIKIVAPVPQFIETESIKICIRREEILHRRL